MKNQKNEKNEVNLQADGQAHSNRRSLLLGVGVSSVAAVWHKPIINALMLPAHAQTSELIRLAPREIPFVAPEERCSMILLGNAEVSASASANPSMCSITFSVLSASPTDELDIVSITTSALAAGTTFVITGDQLGVATDTVGPQATWSGPTVEAPVCTSPTLIDDVTITVTASCVAANGLPFSQDFLLSSLL